MALAVSPVGIEGGDVSGVPERAWPLALRLCRPRRRRPCASLVTTGVPKGISRPTRPIWMGQMRMSGEVAPQVPPVSGSAASQHRSIWDATRLGRLPGPRCREPGGAQKCGFSVRKCSARPRPFTGPGFSARRTGRVWRARRSQEGGGRKVWGKPSSWARARLHGSSASAATRCATGRATGCSRPCRARAVSGSIDAATLRRSGTSVSSGTESPELAES